MAEQRQAHERRANEKTRKALEQAQKAERAEAQQRAATEQTAAVAEQLSRLDAVLAEALSQPPVAFDRMLVPPPTPAFEPGALGQPAPGPDWRDFAPSPPRGLSRVLGGGFRYNRQLTQARDQLAAAETQHRQADEQRRKELAVAKAAYHRKVTEERARAVARNAKLTTRRAAVAAGDAEAVAWFARYVLRASRYPDGFPREHRTAYQPETHELAVDFELPPPRVVPAALSFTYEAGQDEIVPVPRPDAELRQRYQRLIASVTLRALHELFGALPAEVLAVIAFRGQVSTTDRATGRPARPHLVTVTADRAVFAHLVLTEVDPVACVASLGGQVSPDAYDLTPVNPHPLPRTT
jgi:restriction system protein